MIIETSFASEWLMLAVFGGAGFFMVILVIRKLRANAVDTQLTDGYLKQLEEQEGQLQLQDELVNDTDLSIEYERIQWALEHKAIELNQLREKVSILSADNMDLKKGGNQLIAHNAKQKKLLQEKENIINQLREKVDNLQQITQQIKTYDKTEKKAHKALKDILAIYGFLDGSKCLNRTFVGNSTNFPRRIYLSLLVSNVIAHIEKRKDELPSSIYEACQFGYLVDSLKSRRLISLFHKGFSTDSLEARWRSQFQLIFRAHLLVKTYWPKVDSELYWQLAEVVFVLRKILKSKRIIPHKIDLLDEIVFTKSSIEYSPECHVKKALLSDEVFKQQILSQLSEKMIYVDVSTWGFDRMLPDGQLETVDVSKIVGLNEIEQWF